VAEELTLQTLIDKVKTDLFSPYEGTEKEGKVVYPVFLVDEVELKLAVNISYSVESGIEVTIAQVVGASVGAGHEVGQAHTMKIKLSPILDRNEMRDQMKADERLWKGVIEASAMAVRRGTKLAGEEE
jgi:hypothetical protein